MLYHVHCQVVAARCGLLDPEDGGSMTLQNGNNYLPVTWHNILRNLNHQHCEILKSYIVPGFGCTTIFTQMQDFMTSPQKNKSAKGKYIYPNTGCGRKNSPIWVGHSFGWGARTVVGSASSNSGVRAVFIVHHGVVGRT